MVIGLDFDNTIVSYDGVFHRAAVRADLIPATVETDKASVRDYLRKVDREDDWTRLQGRVYGTDILDAQPFPGVHDFLARCRTHGVTVHVVSHKTRAPILGEPVDLHAAAEGWLRANGLLDVARTGLGREHVYFELTKDAKILRIAELGCTHFVDDLPEFLLEPTFPTTVTRVLFDPTGGHGELALLRSARSWSDVGRLIFGAESRHTGD